MTEPVGLQHVQARIMEIQARISQISSKVNPQTTLDNPASFDSVLQSAAIGTNVNTNRGAVAPLMPSYSSVRPLSPTSATSGYDEQITQSAQKYGISPSLIKAVMEVESSGNPSAVSKAGAMGLMQLMPSSASSLGVTDPFNPEQNIDGGAHELANLLSQYNGNVDLALAAYNAGPGAVNKYGGTPPYPETQNYIQKVRDILNGNK